MPIVYLGNTSPIGSDHPTGITTIFANESNRLDSLTAVRNLWPTQSDEPPAWVEGEDERLIEDIADLFSDENHTCEIGRPEDWEG